jgi:hypothetical protein
MPNYVGIQPARPASTQNRVGYTASAGQTAFSAEYSPGYVDVYFNGAKLRDGEDFTATNGTTVTLKTPCALGDSVEIVGIYSSSPYNFYTKAQVDAKLDNYFGVATGTGDAMVLSTTPAVTALTNGMEIKVRAPSANTTSTTPTITLTQLAVTKTITVTGNATVALSTWGTNQELTLRYNQTSDTFELVNLMYARASNSEVVAGTANNRLITPASLTAAFSGQQLKSGTGYQKLPGGVILQWGSTTASNVGDILVTMPIAFPNVLAQVAGNTINAVGSTSNFLSIGNISPTGFIAGVRDHNGTRIGEAITWIAVGY